MVIGKKEINTQLKELTGKELEPLNGNSFLKLINLDHLKDSVTFERENERTVNKKFSLLRILIENLVEFPAINPAQLLGLSYSSIKELVVLLANLPCVSHFKYKSVVYLTVQDVSLSKSGLNELLPGDAEAIIAKVSKFESLDRKVLLKELVNVYNTLGIIEKEKDLTSLKSLTRQLRDFKEQNDTIFEQEIEDANNSEKSEDNDEDLFGDSYCKDDEKFDPSELDIKTQTPTVDLLMSRVKHKEIILNPDFQRNSRIWKDKDKSALIESILLKIPIPVFYMSARPDEKWLIVDGLQRITTIYDFMNGDFALKGLEILDQYEGLKFSQFPRVLERRLRETEFVVHVIQPESPTVATTQIFQRINTKGEKLSDQEIRCSLNVGYSTKFLRKLAESKEFINATDNSINDERMKDIEFALRFCAFYLLNDYNNVNIKTMDSFLVKTMERINEENGYTPLISKLEHDFLKSMKFSRLIFDEFAFRKRYGVKKANSINKALFDTWSVTLAKLDEEQLNNLLSRKEILRDKFEELMSGTLVLANWQQEVNFDRDFEYSISQSTSKSEMIRYRYISIDCLVHKVLNDDF